MESSKLPNATLELGRKIVRELGLEPGVDTLAKWMAHDLAEQIQRCDEASGEDRAVAFGECRETILKLWSHLLNDRQRLPVFKDCDQVIRTLASFDAETPRYLRSYHHPNVADDDLSETQKWLQAAEGLDYTAKILIDYILCLAIEHATNEETIIWLNTARDADALQSDYGGVISIVYERVNNTAKEEDALRQVLANRLQRLESFTSIASALADDLRSRLAKLPEKGKA